MQIPPHEFRQICRKKVFSYTKFRKLALRLPPVCFNFISMVTIIVHKFNWVIHCPMLKTMFLEIAICFPAVGDDNRSWCDPFLNYWQKCLSSRFSTTTRKHFLLFCSIPPNTHCPSTWCPRWYFLFRIYSHQPERFSLLHQTVRCFQVEWFRKLRDRSYPNEHQCLQQVPTRVLSVTDWDLGTTNMSTSESLLVSFGFSRTSSLFLLISLPCAFSRFLAFCIPTSNNRIDHHISSNSSLRRKLDTNVLFLSGLRPSTSQSEFLCLALALPGYRISISRVGDCDHSSLLKSFRIALRGPLLEIRV